MTSNLFDLSDDYDAMLARGLSLTGEGKDYYLAGRLADLRRQLAGVQSPRRILDFGCGIGDTARALVEVFSTEERPVEVVGVDSSENALAHARKTHGSRNISFHPVSDLVDLGPFDLCYVNGVFHHLELGERLVTARRIHQALALGGRLALFENNPWNPGTRLVMRRIPFDRHARLISPSRARLMAAEAGFEEPAAIRFLFFFPKCLALFRFAEPWMAYVPLGGQYCLTAVK